MRVEHMPGFRVAALFFLVYCIIAYITEFADKESSHMLKPTTTMESIITTRSNEFVKPNDNAIERVASVVNLKQRNLKTTAKITEGNQFSDTLIPTHYLKEMYLKNVTVDNVNECEKKNVLSYKCINSLCGGWGDRLKGIVTTFILALLTNRVFVIDMTKPCDLEQFLQQHKYKWAICRNYTRSVSRATTGNGTVHTDTAAAFFKKFKKKDSDKMLKSKVIILTCNAYMISALRHHNDSYERLKWLLQKRDEEIIYLVLHTLFKPDAHLSLDLNKFAVENFKNKHVVCSHIRVGKNPSNPNDSALPKGGPNTTTVLAFLSRFNNSDQYVIYIASDSENVKRDAAKMYSNFVTANRTIVHVDRPDGTRTKGENCAGLYNVLFEHYLLTSCDTLVLTRSNFGAIAAYMRGRSENLFLFQNATNSVINVTLSEIQNKYKFV